MWVHLKVDQSLQLPRERTCKSIHIFSNSCSVIVANNFMKEKKNGTKEKSPDN